MFHVGVVENRHDPLMLGRCQVRVVGLHTDDRSVLPTKDLPWAYPVQPITSAGVSGIGHSPVGPVEGTWVLIVYRDSDKQYPLMMGTFGGIPMSDPNIDPQNLQEIVRKEDQDAVADVDDALPNPGAAVTPGSVLGPVAKLIAPIAKESYDATQTGGGASTNLSNFTIQEVMDRQSAKQVGNAGKYGITPNDLRNAVKVLNIDTALKFNTNIEDMILQEYLACRKHHAVIKYYRGVGNVQDAARALSVDFPPLEDPLYPDYPYGGKDGKFYKDGLRSRIKSTEVQNALQQEYNFRNTGAGKSSPLNNQGVSAAEVKADLLSPTTSPSSSKPAPISGGGSFGGFKGFGGGLLSGIVKQVTGGLTSALGGALGGLSTALGGLTSAIGGGNLNTVLALAGNLTGNQLGAQAIALLGGIAKNANLSGLTSGLASNIALGNTSLFGAQVTAALAQNSNPISAGALTFTNVASPAANIVNKLTSLSQTSFQQVLPIGEKNQYGTTSMGITTTKAGTLNKSQKIAAERPGAIGKGNGFTDSTGIYPLYTDEPDTNRLARNHNITKTIVIGKEAALAKDIPVANGGSWTQPNIPYNAQYPFNHVYQSESGHVMEFDDTKDSERVHIYHKKGTYTEIDPNGSQVNRIVGDGYEIIENNGYVYVKGALNVSVDGAVNLRTDNVLNIEVSGEARINVFNNADINVSGNCNLATRGTFNLKANEVNLESSGDFNIRADKALNIQSTQNMTIRSDSTLFLNAKNAMNITTDEGNLSLFGKGDLNLKTDANWLAESKGRMSLKAGGRLALDGSRIDIQSGASTAAGKAAAPTVNATVVNLEVPQSPRSTAGQSAKSQFNSPGRGAEVGFDSPEDGDPKQMSKKERQQGKVSKEEIEKPKVELEKAPPKGSAAPAGSPPECKAIYAMDASQFTSAMKLSTNFTLGDLTKGGARIPRRIYPLYNHRTKAFIRDITPQEIVCNLKGLCENVLEPIAAKYGRQNIIITSGYRRPTVDGIIGDLGLGPDGKPLIEGGDHVAGCAVDFCFSTKAKTFEVVKELPSVLKSWAQLIMEYQGSQYWIHCAYKPKNNQGDCFTMVSHQTYQGTFPRGGFILV